MKKIIMSLIVALMFVFSAGPALAGDGFGNRAKYHMDRIEEGIRDRSLTDNEVKRLYIFWDSINSRYMQFVGNDGKLGPREADVLRLMQDNMGRSIYKLKHNSAHR